MAGQNLNLRPSFLNLLLYSGDGFSIRLACKDNAGTPIDITGAVVAEVRKDRVHPDDPALATFDASLVDAYLGIIALSLTGVQTESLLEGDVEKFTGVWDVQWTAVGKEPRTIVQGVVECVADVTQ